MTIEVVQQELARLSKEAKGNLDAVREEVKSLKSSNADLVEKNEGLAARFAEFENTALTSVTGRRFASPRKSIGEQFASSDAFKAFANRQAKSATFASDMTLKNVVNLGADSTGDDPYASQAQRDPRLGNDPRRRLTLLSALPTVRISSATYEFVQLNGYSNAADEQAAEGAQKEQASMPTELVSIRPATIAHFLPASEQVLSDVPSLQQQIANLLNYGVQAKAEELIIKGDGLIQGLEELGTAFVGDTGDPLEVAISAAAADMEGQGWMASHVLLNPADWHEMRTRRRGSSDEAYVAGSWMSPPDLNVWGLQVITSPSVTAGTAITLDASQVAIIDRQSVTFEAFREDSTNVRTNTVTLRSEARLGFACYAPTAVRLVQAV